MQDKTGVDADNLTLHVQYFVNVRGVAGDTMIRQGRLYREMITTIMKMMTSRYDIVLFILVLRGTIKVYFHIYKSIFVYV